MAEEKDYQRQMFDTIAKILEETGSEDKTYSNEEKALDILNVLESLLAYSIYNTCISAETIRDSAEESYVNIKKRALRMLKDHPIDPSADS